LSPPLPGELEPCDRQSAVKIIQNAAGDQFFRHALDGLFLFVKVVKGFDPPLTVLRGIETPSGSAYDNAHSYTSAFPTRKATW
jgi:hypothetical protein